MRRSGLRGPTSSNFFDLLSELEINADNLKVIDRNEPYEFTEEFAKLALICFKDYIDYLDEEENY